MRHFRKSANLGILGWQVHILGFGGFPGLGAKLRNWVIIEFLVKFLGIIEKIGKILMKIPKNWVKIDVFLWFSIGIKKKTLFSLHSQFRTPIYTPYSS
jgi:hypothetical protein